MRYVRRDSANSGWLVQLPKRLMDRLASLGHMDVEKATSWFADINYGGSAEAMKVAIEFRDDAFAIAGLNVETLFKSASNQRAVTGLLGVVPGYRVSKPNALKYVARWYALEGTGKREFSVFKMGMKEAFRAAVRHRQEVTCIPFALGAVKYGPAARHRNTPTRHGRCAALRALVRNGGHVAH